MPTYQYRCTECGRDLEVVQKFSDPSLTECPTCSGALRKVFNAVGVVFKGSGFYRNDSRASNGNGSSESNGEKKPAEKSAETSDSKPAESKPSEKPAAETKPSSGNGQASSTGTKAAAS